MNFELLNYMLNHESKQELKWTMRMNFSKLQKKDSVLKMWRQITQNVESVPHQNLPTVLKMWRQITQNVESVPHQNLPTTGTLASL